MRFRHLLLALAWMTVAASSAWALEPSIDGQVPLRDRMAPGRCDPLDPHYCLFPFPNDHFTVADAGMDTGRRVKFSPLSMPANLAGKPINPYEWNRNDGFSPGSPILLRVPGVDLAKSNAVPITHLAAGGRPSQSIVVIDADTLERQLVWAEVDDNHTKGTLCTSLDVGSLLGDVLKQDQIAQITDALAVQCRAHLDLPLAPAADPGPALIIRAARNYREGHRYIVALRNLRNADGETIEAGATFRIFRDRHASSLSFVNDRRDHMEALFATLAQAGIARDSLYLAWDFTVASQRNLSERMLHIRDQAIGKLGGKSPKFTVDEVVTMDPAETRIAREVHGTVTVPNYLNLPGPLSGSRFNYNPPLDLELGGDRLPDVNPIAPTWKVPYTCRIPRTAQGDRKARIALYGHGLLGSQDEVGSGQLSDMAFEHNFVFCAMDWAGLSEKDILNVARILIDFSLFPSLADRSQQGFLNFILLGRAMLAKDGFVTNAAFQDEQGRPLLDRRELFYDGNSQGGIYGGALVAVSPDIRAGVLGVPGMNYSLLLQRSVDFDQYAAILYTTYPASLDQQMVLALMQMLWDRGEANGYAEHLNATNPLPGTPPKRVLLHPALGDHQVTTWAADAEARTIGARTNCPGFVGGPNAQAGPKVQAGVNAAVAAEAVANPALGIGRRHPDDAPLYGIPCIRKYPYKGSAIVYWDGGPLVDASGQPVATGSAPAPIGNVPPRPELGYGADPHSFPRSTALARSQKSEFLKVDGAVRDVCEGKPCATRGFDTSP